MVAFRAKVDGTWQAKFQRRLRDRVAGPAALCASQPSFLSCSPLSSFVLHFSQFFHSFSNSSSFHPFPSSLLFFHLFSTVFQ